MNFGPFVVACSLPLLLVAACGGDAVTSIPIDGGGSDAAADGPALDASTTDSGITFPDSGAGDPKIVDITFADKCPDVAACGGDVVGSWDLSDACVEGVWDEARKACPTLGVKKQSGTVQGRIVFGPNSLSRAVKFSFSATLSFPPACLGNASCSQVQGILLKSFNSATCTTATSGCDCDVGSTSTTTGSGESYSIQGNQLVGGNGNHFDYCVKGSSMTYRWASGPNPERSSYGLTKK